MKTKIYFISIFWLICQSALADDSIKTFKGHQNGVKSIAISNNLLISASKDQTIKVWDINAGTEIRTCYGHNSDVTSISFSPDATQAISGDLDGNIILWDINTCQVSHKFSNETKIKSVSWSPNGNYVLSAHDNGMVKLWDIKAKQELRTFTGHTDQVSDVSFSPDSSKVLSASKDTTIKLWNVETGKEIRIVITSTDDNSLTWQVTEMSFADKFLTQLQKGESLGEAFTFAKQFIQNNTKYFSGQTPWLNDNSDGHMWVMADWLKKYF